MLLPVWSMTTNTSNCPSMLKSATATLPSCGIQEGMLMVFISVTLFWIMSVRLAMETR